MCTGAYCKGWWVGDFAITSKHNNCNGMYIYSGFTLHQDRNTKGVNRVTIQSFLYASKGLVGAWGFHSSANGTILSNGVGFTIDTCDTGYGYNHGEVILIGSTTFNHYGTNAVDIPVTLSHGAGNNGANGFRFTHIGDGKVYVADIAINSSIRIEGAIPINTAPNQPNVTCENGIDFEGYSIVENKIVAKVHATTDPDSGDYIARYRMTCEKLTENQWLPFNGGVFYDKSTHGVGEVDISSVERGSILRLRADAWDKNGQDCAWKDSKHIKRNLLPAMPKMVNPTSAKNFYYDDIYMAWEKAIDPEGFPIKYNIEVSINNSSYTNVITTENNSYTYRILKDEYKTLGTKFKFKITVIEQLCTVGVLYTPIFTKADTRPPSPTNIQPSSGVFLDKVNITWNHVTDPNDEGIALYKVFINGFNIGEVKYDDSKLPSYEWEIPKEAPPGTEYQASIQAIDGVGNEGHIGIATGKFNKTYPLEGEVGCYFTGLTATTSSGIIFNSNLYLNYSYSPKSYEQTKRVYFLIYSSLNYGPWLKHGTLDGGNFIGIIGREYKLDLSKAYPYKHGDNIRCKIIVLDSFNQTTTENFTDVWSYYSIVQSPKIIYPNGNSITYNYKANICLQIDGDESVTNSYIEAVENNTTKNNRLVNGINKNFSSEYSYGNIVYRCSNLTYSSTLANKLRFRKVVLFAGKDINNNNISKILYSDYSDRDLICKNYPLKILQPDFIYAKYYVEMQDILNYICSSYNQNGIQNQNEIKTNDFITYNSLIPPIIETANALIDFINKFDSRNNNIKLKMKADKDINDFIYKSKYYHEIIEYISSI